MGTLLVYVCAVDGRRRHEGRNNRRLWVRRHIEVTETRSMFHYRVVRRSILQGIGTKLVSQHSNIYHNCFQIVCINSPGFSMSQPNKAKAKLNREISPSQTSCSRNELGNNQALIPYSLAAFQLTASSFQIPDSVAGCLA